MLVFFPLFEILTNDARNRSIRHCLTLVNCNFFVFFCFYFTKLSKSIGLFFVVVMFDCY